MFSLRGEKYKYKIKGVKEEKLYNAKFKFEVSVRIHIFKNINFLALFTKRAQDQSYTGSNEHT